MNTPIVTLTTDWGDRDHYAAMVKGRLYTSIPGVRVVDLSHSQGWDSIAVTSKIIQHGCLAFPAGTVHIIDFCEDLSVRHSGDKPYRPLPLLAECRGHFFLCCNRKLLELSLDAGSSNVVALPLSDDIYSDLFVAYSLFCDVAAKLIGGASLAQLGAATAPLVQRGFLRAQFDGTVISARPDSIDHYGNVTLNIKHSDFVNYRAGRSFRMEMEFQVGSIEHLTSVTEVFPYYSDVTQGHMLLTVSSTGYMQLAINQGSLAQLMGVNFSTVCRFIFY